jgi:hypothetical protein
MELQPTMHASVPRGGVPVQCPLSQITDVGRGSRGAVSLPHPCMVRAARDSTAPAPCRNSPQFPLSIVTVPRTFTMNVRKHHPLTSLPSFQRQNLLVELYRRLLLTSPTMASLTLAVHPSNTRLPVVSTSPLRPTTPLSGTGSPLSAQVPHSSSTLKPPSDPFCQVTTAAQS